MVTISFGKSPNLMERDDEHISLDVFPRKMDSWKMKPFRIPIDGSIKGLVCLPTFAPTDPLMGFYSMVPFQDRPIDAEKLQQKRPHKEQRPPKKRMPIFLLANKTNQSSPEISQPPPTTITTCAVLQGEDLAKDMGIDLSVLEKVHEDCEMRFCFFGPKTKKRQQPAKNWCLEGVHPPMFLDFFSNRVLTCLNHFKGEDLITTIRET